MNIYNRIITNKKKQFAVLIDPDKTQGKKISDLAAISTQCAVDYFLVGGSLLANGNFHHCIEILKNNCDIPVIIFPGNARQIDGKADALLFLSLISGRNADLLIGNHVIAAPFIKEQNLEAIPTGYILVDSGNYTAVQYMSNTLPVPADKSEIAACTAMAGEMLGMKLIYMDAGSGAQKPIIESMISEVKNNIAIPLIIGGGIINAKQAEGACKAGADIIVVGNSIEKDRTLIEIIANAIHSI